MFRRGDVLDLHYDERSDLETMEFRPKFLREGESHEALHSIPLHSTATGPTVYPSLGRHPYRRSPGES